MAPLPFVTAGCTPNSKGSGLPLVDLNQAVSVVLNQVLVSDAAELAELLAG